LRNIGGGNSIEQKKILTDEDKLKQVLCAVKVNTQLKRQPTLTEPKSPNFSFKPRQNSVCLIFY
jgi:hypothetical protein